MGHVIILGIETATSQVGCALGGVEGCIASFHATKGRRHAETLVPAIQFVCEQARVEWREVSVVAVDIGPGLFTGLRVGIATAKAMAHALRVPMIGLSSLDLLAFPQRHGSGLVATVVDARRGEVFCALYRPVPGGIQRVTPARVCSPEALASELMAMGEDCLLVGDGAIRYRKVFDDGDLVLADAGFAYPSASSLVELAHPRAIREEFVQPSELSPMYLRKSDAEINWEGRRSA
ncbi:MAG TPA: tRNA (adenosine(37)-N6)-threonylcarbamoyltransferase complex dimerization subunit type 1 TsaB [Acidimicrobiales bacterium]|nr:tRNA (adenosine(37)-N6)-threonylcarbamoyltransferase complex dimerization subunit type 1 TsaB [Acidimicrobiales bacterium]